MLVMKNPNPFRVSRQCLLRHRDRLMRRARPGLHGTSALASQSAVWPRLPLLSLLFAMALGIALEGCDLEAPGRRVAGPVTAPALREISGVTPAQREDYYWVHNDSGDRPTIYALALTGRLVATVDVYGAFALDWEDIASAPAADDGARLLYIADTGNNFRLRSELALYRIPEPLLGKPRRKPDGDPHPSGERRRSAPAERFRFRYESGRRDCEALAISPRGDAAYLFSKGDATEVFRLKLGEPGEEVHVARQVAKLGVSQVTAASLSAVRSGFLLVSKRSILEFRGGAGSPEEWLGKPPRVVATFGRDVQLEAVTYDHTSTGFVTVAEGNPTAIHRFRLPEG